MHFSTIINIAYLKLLLSPNSSYSFVWSITIEIYKPKTKSIYKNKFSKGASKYNLEKISKEDFTYLIQKNILSQKNGNYGDSLVVTGKFGSGRGKQRFVTLPIYNYLMSLKSRDKMDMDKDKVKHNQRYLFSSNDVSSNVSVS